jgi:hypothetical protein
MFVSFETQDASRVRAEVLKYVGIPFSRNSARIHPSLSSDSDRISCESYMELINSTKEDSISVILNFVIR